MVAIAKYIPANQEYLFNEICSDKEWDDPRCPFCINKMEVAALRCVRCKGEWKDGEMSKRK